MAVQIQSSGFVGFMVDKMALGLVFSHVLGLLPLSFHQLLHTPILICELGLVQWANWWLAYAK
jgi:hypothetical protein